MIFILPAIRITLYLLVAASLLSQPLTLVTGFLVFGCLTMAVGLGILEYKCQVSDSTQSDRTVYRNEGMWCRMCGGACDLDNCGMEQP